MSKRVTRTGKDGDGDITSLCGDGFRDSKATAIANINANANAYYVEEVAPRVYVEVVYGHLRTTADETDANNLDNLPPC